MIAKEKFNVHEHILVPKHTKLSDKEHKELFERYNITENELPAIMIKDPALANLDVEPGDIIKIQRPSPTAKSTLFYRRVIK